MAVTPFNERPEGFNTFTNHEGQNVRIDPPLAHNILSLYEAAKKTNGDLVLVIDGEEGSGKSTLGRQIARFLDKEFTETRMEFNPEDAIKAHFRGLEENWTQNYQDYKEGHLEGKPWECIILDESADLDRKRTMSTGSVEFTSFMTQSRQLHKIFIIILPNIHILNGYVAEHRTVALIHCYKHEQTEMGFYRWYGRKAIKEMFSPMMHRQKLYSRRKSFAGRFSGREAFDITRYNIKKAKALDRYRKIEIAKAEDPEDVLRLKYERIMTVFLENKFEHDKIMYTCLELRDNAWRRLKKQTQEKLGIKPKPRGRYAKLLKNLEADKNSKKENEEY